MDLLQPSGDATRLLLQLPATDLYPNDSVTMHSYSTTGVSQHGVSKSNDNPLLLLELPDNATADTLRNSHIVAGDPSDQAVLVVNDENKSYSLSRIETSNTLVLVPPPPMESKDFDNEAQSSPSNENEDTISSTTPSNDLTTTPVRLVGTNLTPHQHRSKEGAFFLSLAPRQLGRHALRRLLAATTDAPLTVEELTTRLRVATGQVLETLTEIDEAYCCTPSDSSKLDSQQKWTLLSDDVVDIVHRVLLETLTEEAHDYAHQPIDVAAIATSAWDRLSESELFPDADRVLRHVLQNLCVQNTSSADTAWLNVTKVATICARRIMALPPPNRIKGQDVLAWPEDVLMEKWQAFVPGVGDAYKVSTDTLGGVASWKDVMVETVVVEGMDGLANETKEMPLRLWKYLPACLILSSSSSTVSDEECIPSTSFRKAFDVLFQWKNQWPYEELQPYLKVMADAAANNDNAAQLLLAEYTYTGAAAGNGKVYMQR